MSLYYDQSRSEKGRCLYVTGGKRTNKHRGSTQSHATTILMDNEGNLSTSKSNTAKTNRPLLQLALANGPMEEIVG